MTSQPPAKGADLNLAILGPLFAYVEATHGRQRLDELALASGLALADITKPQRWVTLATFEAALRGVRDLAGSDEAFMTACSYDMVRFYGPLALVFRAATPTMSYTLLARTVHFASRISTYELVESSARSVTLRYRSTREESRLMCLSRQAQLPMPLLFWKLAPSTFRESKCIARGDDCCEYHIRWSEPLPWRLPLAGTLVGLGVSVLLELTHAAPSFPWAIVAMGALGGTALALRTMLRRAHEFHTSTTEEVAGAVKQLQTSVEQILDLHQRQEAFNALMAERIEARTATLEAMLGELHSVRTRSEAELRGLSHDMRTPMQIALANAQWLSEYDEDTDIADAGRAIADSTRKVEEQLKRLLAIASAKNTAFDLHNVRVVVVPFVDRIRKNLQALAIARDIKVSVFRTREAPDVVETDTLLFDRVIDNLVSNAVKYTDRGSIVVEVGGAPGHLSIKISDTGRGISPERLEEVFAGGVRDARPLLGESHGIGLSNTVRLLDELGGHLEVMSRPNVGTTVWAHIPVEAPRRESGVHRSADAVELVKRVVTIRKVAANT